jgi:hypothetical protein
MHYLKPMAPEKAYKNEHDADVKERILLLNVYHKINSI